MIFITWWELVRTKLELWWIKLVKLTPNLFLAFIVLIIFFFLARVIRKSMYRLTIRMSGKPSVSGLFSTVTSTVIVLVGIFIALDILQLDKAVSSLLAGAGIIGLALGFAFQDLTANFISGIYIAFRRPFDVGNTVETNGYIGNIENIQLRSTTMRTFQGLHLMIPNRDIFQKPMINHSLSIDRRVELDFSLALGTDVDKAVQTSKKAIEELSYLCKEKPVEVYFTGWQDNALRMSVWFWINNQQPPGFMVARHDAIINISKAFAVNDIRMDVPLSLQESRTIFQKKNGG
ncbi:MAG TPA: mechanosensitive ion channel family protein [Flavitalea sp.]|nr:mechanosensitive ion channel family protein [Flavitalea sp.]